MDLDPLFSATVVLLLARAVDARFVEAEPQWLGKSTAILEEMIANGNQIASFRKGEMLKLRELIDEFITAHHPATFDTAAPQPNTLWSQLSHSTPAAHDTIQPSIETSLPGNTMSLYSGVDSDGQVDELTAEQILAVASSMDWGDIEWSFTVDNG